MPYHTLNEPNVAYDGTSSDLNFNIASFFKAGADMNLFGHDEPRLENAMYQNSNSAIYQNSATVSPQQLTRNTMGSIPSSANIPDMSYSPDSMETPLFDNSADPSPYLADNMGFSTMSNYPPLFPTQETSAFEVPSVQQPANATTDSRKRSASLLPASSRPTGVRKKSKQLLPINIDESDPVSAKRARNTEAARRSRAKKNEHVDALEAKIEQLQSQLAAVQQENAQLKAQCGTNPVQQDPFDDDLARLLSA